MTPAELAAIRRRAANPAPGDVLALLAEIETLTHERDENYRLAEHRRVKLDTVRHQARRLAGMDPAHWPDSVHAGRYLLSLVGEDDG